MTTSRSAVVAGVFAFAVLGAGIAVAAIPNGNTINACRDKTTFLIRVIDTSKSQTCSVSETALSWTSFHWRGAWKASTSYSIGDAVSYGGQSYIATAASSNHAPTDKTVWDLMAARGKPGIAPGIGAHTNTATLGGVAGTCVLGQINLYAGSIVPAGQLIANGQLLPINQNQALWSLLGTTYGGNGVANFALPNLDKLAPDNMTYTICVNGTYP